MAKITTYYAKNRPYFRVGNLKFSAEGFITVDNTKDKKLIESTNEYKFGLIIKEESIADALEKERKEQAELDLAGADEEF